MTNQDVLNPTVFHGMIELYAALIEVERDLSRKRKALALKIEQDWELLPAEARKSTKTTMQDIAREAKISPRNDELSLEWLASRLF
jgi:hypothetical protein